jgi:peptide chain release factor subunit 1
MREVLRLLAAIEPSDLLVLSIYLDMRPQATGQNPSVRSGRIVLKDRLREIEKTLGPRGPALDSFHADAERIERYLDEEAPSESQGIAIFACHAQELFVHVQAGVAFDNQVTASPLPDLYQLARLLDEQETAVMALVDSNTVRLFVTRTGEFDEVGGPDDDSVHYRKRSTGGWSQARYQRHIEKHRADFAQEAAAEIKRLVTREGAVRLILAGDEVAITPLRAALSPDIAALIHGDALRIHIRTPQDEVDAAVAPLLAQAEADDACSDGDRLVQAVQAGGLAVAGLPETRQALEYGQVDTLVLDPAAPIDEETRSSLIRQATMTGAEVEMVAEHPVVAELGGVGALLRYRLDGPTAEPALAGQSAPRAGSGQ